AGGGNTYTWNTGSTTDTIRVFRAGIYIVTVSNTCGSDSARLVVQTDSAPKALITGPAIICIGDAATLTASGGTTYSWSNGANTNSITVSTPGIYEVVATNLCGQDSMQTTLISNSVTALFTADSISGYAPLPVIFADGSSPNTTSWSWNFGDGITGSGKGSTHTYTTAGTFTVTLSVTDAFGCTNTYVQVIVVKDLPSWIYVPNIFTPNGDGKNDDFHITSQGLASFDAKIYDRWGVLLSELDAPDQGWDGRTSAGLSAVAGTYFYIIQASGYDGKKYDLNGFLLLIRE
ncbi:MAG TPA: gliding motility-associated C-terminal domain-containing protein, partial [Bacteroidia bacterium]|nr:gliding motility-associated C-terminal domain-containing protein [Bacteroidia bacterium]